MVETESKKLIEEQNGVKVDSEKVHAPFPVMEDDDDADDAQTKSTTDRFDGRSSSSPSSSASSSPSSSPSSPSSSCSSSPFQSVFDFGSCYSSVHSSKRLHIASLLCESVYIAQHSTHDARVFLDSHLSLTGHLSLSFHTCVSDNYNYLCAENTSEKTLYLVFPGTRMMSCNLWKLATSPWARTRLLSDININCKINGQHIQQTHCRHKHDASPQIAVDQEEALRGLSDQKSGHCEYYVHSGYFQRASSIHIHECIDRFMQGWRIVFVGHSAGGAIAHLVTLRFLREIMATKQKTEKYQDDQGEEEEEDGRFLENRVSSIAFGAPFFGDALFADYLERIHLSPLLLTVISENDIMSSILDYDVDPESAILTSITRPIRDWMLSTFGVKHQDIGVHFQPAGIYCIESGSAWFNCMTDRFVIRRRLRQFSFKPWDAKTAHEMKNYVRLMQQWNSIVTPAVAS